MIMVALRIALIEARIHQYELARRSGISETNLSRILCGRREPTAEERHTLACALGKPESVLFPTRES